VEARGALEALLLDLGLGRGDGGGGVGVDEVAAQLAVLVGGSLGGADTLALAVVGAAGVAGLAVGVVDAPSGDELLAVTGTDVLGTSVVGLDEGQSRDGD